MSMTPLTLTPRHAGQALGMGRKRVYYLMKTGKLPHLKVGSRYYIPWLALEAFLKRALQVPGQKDGMKAEEGENA